MLALKMFHVLFLFVWIGTLLSLTRLLGYLPKEEGESQSKMVRICKRMYFFVDLPCMILSIITGVYLLNFAKFGDSLGWFHMKMTFAVLLIVCDIVTGVQIKKAQRVLLSGKGIKFKILHGITALFLIGVLCSIYIVRNKEQEIRTRIERELGKNNEKAV